MSYFIKNNPYNIFKVNSNRLIYRRLFAKKEPNIDSDSKNNTQRLLLSKILKKTKSILKNKNKFSGYMDEYQSLVAKSTFKSPDIQNYPLLRKEVSSMIPLKSLKIEKKKSSKIIKNILKKPISLEAFKEKYKHNLSLNMSSIEILIIKIILNYIKKKKQKKIYYYFPIFFINGIII